MFGMPNMTEVDGTVPHSEPHEDFSLEVSTSSCDRRVQASETENSFRSQGKPPRPLHRLPHGPIKQKTPLMLPFEIFSVFGMPNTEK
ncbi:hypothetical protein ABL850_11100 [Variovorax paradoxus]|uniref:hypothetical protein n=1 Tax=Variovorax paradoxus TaxID=34073 RepID=UPI003AAB76EE